MAQLTVFGYRYRDSFIHAMDVRVKLAALISVSIASLDAGPVGLMLASAMALLVFYQVKLPLRQALLELRWFLLLVLFVWSVRGLSTPGEPLVVWCGIELTYQGVLAGAMISWRWLLIVCLGLCLSTSTKTADIGAAVQWGLRPLLGNSVYKIGLMIGLLMRCIVMILSQAREIANAQRARAIDNRKSPIYRVRMTAMPLMRSSFLSADRMATAIASRCYGDTRTPHPWHFTRNDAIAMVATLSLCTAMLLV